MLSFIFTDDLFNELLRLRNLKFRQHGVFNVLILAIKALDSTFLHLCEAIRDVNTTLLNFSLDVTVLNELFCHNFQLLLLNSKLLS